MIAIVDYGMGNLRSVEKALLKLGHPAVISSDPDELLRADRLILPGVGAFGAAMANLTRAEADGASLDEAVRQFVRSGRPFFGICLGMQLLLTESEELGQHRGLDLLPGQVVRFDFADDPTLKIPHMGWNALHFPRPTPLFAGLEEGTQVYFVHGFHCVPDEPEVTAATCTHGIPFCAALAKDNVFAAQFHPEKSGAAGLRILDNFARL
ncbi:MAG: imidazole glycerol phosphate synthase subunit HisH [Armatimonadota bacterium]